MSGKGDLLTVLGAQWGDEGKGKIVDFFAADYDVVCRCQVCIYILFFKICITKQFLLFFQGGNNAGHTVVVDNVEFDFHLLPSGIVNKKAMCVIGNGVVVHLPQLLAEIEKNLAKSPLMEGWESRLIISNRAHLVFDFHQEIDGIQESQRGSNSLGTTKRGIGPCYASKATRSGLRMCDLIGDFDSFEQKFRFVTSSLMEQYPTLKVDVEGEIARYKGYREKIRPMIADTVTYLSKAISSGKKILIEGANATLLDIDFGLYPFVTSSNCCIGGVCTGLGIPPYLLKNTVAVVKAYTTRVGVGHFPTYQENEIGELLQNKGKEWGVTSGRKRRCGWLDLFAVKYTHTINGFTALAVTKLDILDSLPELKVGVGYSIDGKALDYYPATNDELERVDVDYVTMPGWHPTSTSNCRSWDELPDQAKAYLELIEKVTGVPVRYIGVGAKRDAIIDRFAK